MRKLGWKDLQRPLIYLGVLLVLLLPIFLLLTGKIPTPPIEKIPIPKVPPEISQLPGYLLLSYLRMWAAFGISLIFGFAIGTWAATRPGAARFLLPGLDILQAVPVLGFFPVVVALFIEPLGAGRFAFEIATVFLCVSSMAWNLAYAVYEAIHTLPTEAREAMTAYGVSGWHRFYRLYLPASVPKVVYNSILSWSNGWYFLIACEIIAVGPVKTVLPGIGSFLTQSAEEGRLDLTLTGLLMLIALIASKEFLFWRPLTGWSEKYRYDFKSTSTRSFTEPRFVVKWRELHLRNRVRLLKHWAEKKFLEPVLRLGEPLARFKPTPQWRAKQDAALVKLAMGLGILLLGYLVYAAGRSGYETLTQPLPERAFDLPLAMAHSFLRLVLALVVSVAIALPLAVWAGERKRVERFVAPIAEIGASIPATALFPIIVIFVIKIGGMELAAILLLLTGMTWYLVFNLLAGVRAIPEELREATRSMNLRGWQKWKHLRLPALFPSLLTGGITAFGGGWNALIVSEYFVYQRQTYQVFGVGAILQEATFEQHDSQLVLLTILALVVTVVAINQFFWKPLYGVAAERFKIESS